MRAMGLGTGLSVFLLVHPVILYYLVGGAMIMLCAVVLPAVWSRKAARRRAALAVLDRVAAVFGPSGAASPLSASPELRTK
jgi:hypothetical protein